MLNDGQEAEIRAILNSGRTEIDKFLVVSAMESKDAINRIEGELVTTKAIKRLLTVISTSIIAGIAIEVIHFVF